MAIAVQSSEARADITARRSIPPIETEMADAAIGEAERIYCVENLLPRAAKNPQVWIEIARTCYKAGSVELSHLSDEQLHHLVAVACFGSQK